MKKMFLSLVLCFTIMFCMIPIGTFTVSAAYNANSAVSYANTYWNDGVGLCAEFVSRCLAQGGISIPNYSYYSYNTQSYKNNSGILESWTNPYTCSAALLLYLSESGYRIIELPSNSDISVGDVVFMKSSSGYKDGHVGICISNNGSAIYAAHNKATNNGKFYSDYPCTYVAKMNGVPPSPHTVNTSYGTNFTAYPKSKITAENIFDANHNKISSTAWIGTSDKCTIHEVYTDGCCKVSYPLDSGGTQTAYSKISLFNTHTHSYTGARFQEPDHPHVITQRCVDYATCGGYIVTGEYGQSKTCQQCWRVIWSVSASSISVNVGQSKSINVSIDGIWPDTAKVFSDWDESLFSYTLSQGVLTVTGLKKGTGKIKISIYSDANKSVLIGEKTISVTVSDPTYTGRVSFDKSSISLVMPDNKTSTLNIELTGTWPEGAGYTFDYNSNVVSMTQNGTVLTITAKNAGSTIFTINIVNKNNNNALITSAVCPITVKNATYTIKYNANGGNGAPSSQTKYYNTDLTLSSTKPTRSGYIFLGWSTSSTATSATYSAGGTYTANTGVTLYAVWIIDSKEMNLNASTTANISTAGEKKYYTYTPTTSGKYVIYSTGTDENDAYVTLYDGNGNELAKNDDGGGGRQFLLTYDLTAGTKYKYEIKLYSSSKTGNIPFTFGKVYTVTYNANNGSNAPSSQEKYYGKSLTLSSTKPTRTGYSFLGWATSSTATTASYSAGGSFTTDADTTLYAVWKDNTNPTGSISSTNNVASSQTVTLTLKDNVGVAGYYWGTSSTYSNNTYTSVSGAPTSTTVSKTISSSGTYYLTVKDTAGNISSSYSIVFYKITLNSNGGSVSLTSVIVKSGNTITLPTPTKSGSTFIGWSTSSTATTASYSAGDGFIANASTTLYAIWETNDTVNPTGSISSTNNVASSQTVTLTLQDNVAVAGYYWGTNSTYSSNVYTSFSILPTNINISRSKTISNSGTYYLTVKDIFGNVSSTYTITFVEITLNANGGSVSPTSIIVKSGNTIILPTPTKSGATFIGWSTSSTATTASYYAGGTFTTNAETTLYAVWKRKSGDCNGDGNIDAQDLIVLRKAILTDFEYNEDLDANGDGVVDIRDLVRLKKLLAS